MEKLLQSHDEATTRRMQTHPVILAVQDTTSLNYTAHPMTEGLGPINTKGDGRSFLSYRNAHRLIQIDGK